MEAAGLERVRERDGVARALDVREPVALLARGHVVDRGEVEEVVDRRRAARRSPRRSSPAAAREVAEHRADAPAAPPQRAISASSRPIDPARTSTWISPSRSSSRSTRWRPMKPVAPVTK